MNLFDKLRAYVGQKTFPNDPIWMFDGVYVKLDIGLYETIFGVTHGGMWKVRGTMYKNKYKEVKQNWYGRWVSSGRYLYTDKDY